ncbi:uncharacterized protein LOC129786600 [Lutzomyia longipalpis]|uniref:uncharacterized protein LOC129786600 n=1 Tax=Lutzomyia longipalpis TaxID=7200 RepID=UPI002483CFD3|nr:uncharacterized protein LOC129786600 [Lutzomyia longipalpis]
MPSNRGRRSGLVRNAMHQDDSLREERNDHIPRVGPSEIFAILSRFDPDDTRCITSDLWIEEVETAREIYTWSDRATILYASMRLCGTAKTWYHAAKSRLTTWEIFSRELRTNFPSRVDIPKVHEQLTKRKKSPKETIVAYYHDMVALGAKIKLDDVSMRQYIIAGIPLASRRTALRNRQYNSLPELLVALQDTEGEDDEETTKHQRFSRNHFRSRRREPYSQDNHRTAREGSSRDHTKEKTNDSTSENLQRKSTDRKERVCYRCREHGHLIANCPKNIRIFG